MPCRPCINALKTRHFSTHKANKALGLGNHLQATTRYSENRRSNFPPMISQIFFVFTGHQPKSASQWSGNQPYIRNGMTRFKAKQTESRESDSHRSLYGDPAGRPVKQSVPSNPIPRNTDLARAHLCRTVTVEHTRLYTVARAMFALYICQRWQ